MSLQSVSASVKVESAGPSTCAGENLRRAVREDFEVGPTILLYRIPRHGGVLVECSAEAGKQSCRAR